MVTNTRMSIVIAAQKLSTGANGDVIYTDHSNQKEQEEINGKIRLKKIYGMTLMSQFFKKSISQPPIITKTFLKLILVQTGIMTDTATMEVKALIKNTRDKFTTLVIGIQIPEAYPTLEVIITVKTEEATIEDTIQTILTPLEVIRTSPTIEVEDFLVTAEVQSTLPNFNSNTDYNTIKSARDTNVKLLVNLFMIRTTVLTMPDCTNHTTKIFNKGWRRRA